MNLRSRRLEKRFAEREIAERKAKSYIANQEDEDDDRSSEDYNEAKNQALTSTSLAINDLFGADNMEEDELGEASSVDDSQSKNVVLKPMLESARRGDFIDRVHIQLRNASFAVKSNGRVVKLIDNVSIDVKSGSVTALMGSSGAGKVIYSCFVFCILYLYLFLKEKSNDLFCKHNFRVLF